MADAILETAEAQRSQGSRDIDGKDQHDRLRHGETHHLLGIYGSQRNDDGNPGLVEGTAHEQQAKLPESLTHLAPRQRKRSQRETTAIADGPARSRSQSAAGITETANSAAIANMTRGTVSAALSPCAPRSARWIRPAPARAGHRRSPIPSPAADTAKRVRCRDLGQERSD